MFFFKHIKIFQSVITRIKSINNLNLSEALVKLKLSYQSSEGDTLLQLLAKEPLQANDFKLDLIMDLLEAGSKPNLQNKAGKTFLQDSNIKHLLLNRIENSPRKWANDLFKAWVDTKEGSCHIIVYFYY